MATGGRNTLFAQRVVDLRVRVGIANPTKLAKKLKISQPSMRAIEQGDTSPDDLKAGTFMKLVDALATNPRYLFTGRGPKGPLLGAEQEESELAEMYREMHPALRAAWVAAGRALVQHGPSFAADMSDVADARKRAAALDGE